MTKVAHIINIAGFPKGHELELAQKITIESLVNAKFHASKSNLEIELHAAFFEEDKKLVPEGFSLCRPLQQSILNFPHLGESRKLPLLKEILDRFYENTTAEYLIYSNIDIGLMPGFYLAVKRYIDAGNDALIINRRIISSRYLNSESLEEIFAEAGEMHNGFDCFIFKRERYQEFHLGNVCLGIPHFCNLLAHNLFRYSENFKLLTDKHLSFHVGMDHVKYWGNRKVTKHNYSIFRKELVALSNGMKISNMPGAGLPFFKRHWKWLMNPNFHYPTMLKLDLTQWNAPRKKPLPPFKKTWKSRYYTWLVKKIKLE
ncbi:MAG: hypothetical protein ACK40M_01590 [Flavobacteriales bacterium]